MALSVSQNFHLLPLTKHLSGPFLEEKLLWVELLGYNDVYIAELCGVVKGITHSNLITYKLEIKK